MAVSQHDDTPDLKLEADKSHQDRATPFPTQRTLTPGRGEPLMADDRQKRVMPKDFMATWDSNRFSLICLFSLGQTAGAQHQLAMGERICTTRGRGYKPLA